MKRSRSFKTYIFFAEAWAALLFARIILVYLPFKKIAPHLGTSSDKLPDMLVNKQQLCDDTKRSVLRACRYAPWRTMCFEQAIAAKIMLNRRKIKSELYFGLCRDEATSAIQAHAWLKCREKVITGGNNVEKFKIISVF